MRVSFVLYFCIFLSKFYVHFHKKMLIISVCILLRAPTADVPYVPNAKYFAHLTRQIPFDPIYQMCHISYFLRHATIQVQIFHSTERVWHMFYSFFIPLSLSSVRQSHLVPQSFPLSLTPILSSQTPTLTALPRPHPRPR